MAYALKYTTYKQFPNGDKYTLNIYQKDYNGSPLEIAVLTGFNLQIQGDQSALTAPIIKTSVNISLKDTLVENAQGQMVSVLGGKKYGQWEEFYTNDPVKYRVDVVYSGGLTRNATIWSGFLTPDSWGEEMVYGGDINLTARDMLGYLDEQEFDLTGRVTIQSLIQAAITKSKASMSSVSFKTAECLYNSNGQSILAATIGASTYSGNTWYQALEKVLESLGLVLRYDGNGGWLVTSLRYLASHTHETHTPCFTGRSGYRTLDPAVKQIVETFDPKIESYQPDDPATADFVSNGTTITQYITTEPTQGGGSVQPPSHITNTFNGYTLTRPADGKGWAGTLGQPQLRTPKYGSTDRRMYIPTDVNSGQTLTYASPELKLPFVIKFGLEGNCLVKYGTALAPSGVINIYTPITNDDNDHSLSKVVYQITCTKSNATYHIDEYGRWMEGAGVDQEIGHNEELEVPTLEGASDIIITLVKLVTTHKNFNERTITNLLAPLTMTIAPSGSNDLAGEYKTTTIYCEDNHNEINRDPSIGAATTDMVSLPMVKNILGYGNDIATDAWKFSADANTFPLAVMIHAQLLVYNGQMEDSQGNTTGNSIFTGNLHDYTRVPAAPCTKYTYFGRNCILLSGAYNLLTGEVDSVTLREVFGWDDVWDTFNPTYSVKTSRNEGGTASAGGGGSASGGGGGGTAQAVWGQITGTLSQQTDLQNALDGKVAKSGGTMTGELSVTGSLNINKSTYGSHEAVFCPNGVKRWLTGVWQDTNNFSWDVSNDSGTDWLFGRMKLTPSGGLSIYGNMSVGNDCGMYLSGNNAYGASNWWMHAYGPTLQFENTGNSTQPIVIGDSDIRFFQAGNGNVGIGTSSPTEKLHVEGSIKASGQITSQGLPVVKGSGAQKIVVANQAGSDPNTIYFVV